MTGPKSVIILDRSVPRGLIRAAGVLMDALRTHAMVLVDGVVHHNPYYIDPREFLHGTGSE
jgi:hypothetical protein